MNSTSTPNVSFAKMQNPPVPEPIPAPTTLKHRIAFAMLMGVITTGVISFTLISLNLGFNERFLRIWLKSWAVGYMVAIPAILILSPSVQRVVNWLLRKSAGSSFAPGAPRPA